MIPSRQWMPDPRAQWHLTDAHALVPQLLFPKKFLSTLSYGELGKKCDRYRVYFSRLQFNSMRRGSSPKFPPRSFFSATAI